MVSYLWKHIHWWTFSTLLNDSLGLIALKKYEQNMSNNISYSIYEIIINQPPNAANWTSAKCLMMLLPEMPALPIFAISIYIMNQGVEFGHPVYSVLFLNLIFSLGVTILIVVASFICDISGWTYISSIGNMIAMLFHHSSWAVLSVLR